MLDFRTYKNRFTAYRMKLSIGDDLIVTKNGRTTLNNCRFVKVTRKGFNIIDLDTNRVVLKRHLYAIGMGGKEFPSRGKITGDFWIPESLKVQVKGSCQRKIS